MPSCPFVDHRSCDECEQDYERHKIPAQGHSSIRAGLRKYRTRYNAGAMTLDRTGARLDSRSCSGAATVTGQTQQIRPKRQKPCVDCGEVITRRFPGRGIPKTCSDECALEAISRANRKDPDSPAVAGSAPPAPKSSGPAAARHRLPGRCPRLEVRI